MELNYKTTKLIINVAYQVNEVRMCDGLIKSFPGDSGFLESRRDSIKKINKLCREFKKRYNMSNRKYNAVIYKLVCSQFINFEVSAKGEEYNEEMDGPLLPVFNGNWSDTLDGYQPNYMLSKEMLSMKFGSLRTPFTFIHTIKKNNKSRRRYDPTIKSVMVSLSYDTGSTIGLWDVQAHTIEDVYKDIRKSVGPEMEVDKNNPYIMYGYGNLVAVISQLSFEE